MTAEAIIISVLLQSSPLSWPPAINIGLLLAARLAPMQPQNKAVNTAAEGNPDLAMLKCLPFHSDSETTSRIWKVLSNV